MKRTLTFLMAITMLAQSIGALWVTAAFFLNRDYLAKNECTYRAVAENTCKGQCVLMKKLKAHQKQEQQQTGFVLKEILLFSHSTEAHDITRHLPTFELRFVAYPWTSPHYAYQYFTSIFHPPLVARA